MTCNTLGAGEPGYESHDEYLTDVREQDSQASLEGAVKCIDFQTKSELVRSQCLQGSPSRIEYHDTAANEGTYRHIISTVKSSRVSSCRFKSSNRLFSTYAMTAK